MKTALLLAVLGFTAYAHAQEIKTVTDCTVIYDVSVEDTKASADVVKAMEGTTKVLYIRGAKSRSDLETPAFRQTIIYDAKSDSAVVLREMGNGKYISYLDSKTLQEKHRKYEGITFQATGEKKTILAYECDKVIAKLPDGSAYNVYYTPAIEPVNKEYEYQFKDLPGLVLEYEALSEDGKTRVKYTASKISLMPVPVAKFDIPKSGYRVL